MLEDQKFCQKEKNNDQNDLVLYQNFKPFGVINMCMCQLPTVKNKCPFVVFSENVILST